MSLVKDAWLEGATAAETTTEPEEVTGATRFGLQVQITGSPSAASVWLEGSIDGENWYSLIVAHSTSSALYGFGLAATAPVVRFVRLRVDELDGGTSPTVTASVVAV